MKTKKTGASYSSWKLQLKLKKNNKQHGGTNAKPVMCVNKPSHFWKTSSGTRVSRVNIASAVNSASAVNIAYVFVSGYTYTEACR